ncbi:MULTISPECIES: phosphoribosylanthranilate isomerase [Brevibacillus]|jgi:phosphoribosylanthranilate isomerase|uniref:N-(5'-phosphoribosyl)anthranilate isomerase n=1 Tax=Brevibacillus borstelensis AK1 TaxID=1300222 RepID=M8DJ44_9BACL|nr:phosphoribosylanthranilate isomerase [Brevibacillus borstelensis]EMT53583.1 N-(5'-phosphoribosyl)anthranilate isomerase [Brevibacillus borstelensis AK1]MBE5397809.1 phosphoribosylanthranilate isomerase [Brevibacillus borstelensis]MED1874897.1 phosphoribosylanthranilate isomerase [Brevibacillus borstelensis]MED2011368.1 phosphoribosylanthranilate isomerase [Brevibacillus borstelensis]WNF03664.1 phosphoribosylanthranilate isomerase [Brevibacillus borstelensis]
MTKIKICGIKRAETLACLTALAVDYVGFVFAQSRRQVTAEQAGAIMNAVPGHPPAVGVFVDPTLAELEEVLEQAELSVIQLHGRETPDFCQQVQERFSLPVWKAMAVGSDNGAHAGAEQIEAYLGVTNALLFDTYDPALAGGTGKRFSWEQIPLLQQSASPLPCIIAGGIHAENVGELIRNYRPSVIDVSSGVETEGEKDEQKIREFVGRVREA